MVELQPPINRAHYRDFQCLSSGAPLEMCTTGQARSLKEDAKIVCVILSSTSIMLCSRRKQASLLGPPSCLSKRATYAPACTHHMRALTPVSRKRNSFRSAVVMLELTYGGVSAAHKPGGMAHIICERRSSYSSYSPYNVHHPSTGPVPGTVIASAPLRVCCDILYIPMPSAPRARSSPTC